MPGEDSHYKMEPEIRRKWRESNILDKRRPRKAAVMALFYPSHQELTQLLLILRKSNQGVHSNQIGFPGGKTEKQDTDLLHTAMRETYEEVGVPPQAVKVVKELSELYIPPSNFLVKPFMGLYPKPGPFSVQESEVEALVEVDLNEFLDERNQIQQKMTTSYAQDILVPAFKLKGYTVWGATAMMLNEIKELLHKVL